MNYAQNINYILIIIGIYYKVSPTLLETFQRPQIDTQIKNIKIF